MFFSAAVIVLFMLFFVDRGERPITALLCVLAFFDHPFHDGPGGLQPVAMQRVLTNLDHVLRDKVVVAPCDDEGVALAGG